MTGSPCSWTTTSFAYIVGLFSTYCRSFFLTTLNDRQSLLLMDNNLEKLKVHAISMLDLPVNERLICTSKATYKCREANYGSDVEPTDRGKMKKIRLIGMCVCVRVCVCVCACVRVCMRACACVRVIECKYIYMTVMSNYLILDPEIFGPTISSTAEVLLWYEFSV